MPSPRHLIRRRRTHPDSESKTGGESRTGGEPRTGGEVRHLAGPTPRLPAVLGAATVVLAGLAVWSGLEAHRLHGGAAARNTALTDAARTSEVKGEITDAVNKLFSYDYADPAKTDRVVRTLLTGGALRQYNALVQPVRQRAAKDKLVLTTTVTDSGVELLQGDRARLLIFVDQRNTRTVDDQTAYGTAMLAVNAVSQNGRWKIENIDTLAGG
jgi:Mce-associated membrane protein